jgi:hypothetical protein
MVQIYWEYLSDLFQGLTHFRKLIICNQNRRCVCGVAHQPEHLSVGTLLVHQQETMHNI